jgi:Na+-transporting methylmalonyl-CoA/oxaloacetate decarboxylase gamma subunit
MMMRGVELTLIGISVVFFLLWLLVVVVELNYRVLRVLNRFFPETENEPVQGRPSGAAVETDVAVAIAAVKAFQQHRG